VRRAIGVATAEQIVTGLVEERRLAGDLRHYREDSESLLSMPPGDIASCLAREIKAVAGDTGVDAIGIGLPGIVREGCVEESPNLRQLKGIPMCDLMSKALHEVGIVAPVFIYNDADAVAAGLAATRDLLDRLIRVWTLGNGIGFGVYPWSEGIWEGGHMVVSLDPREQFCACGGVGHLEGFMGQRAMRLRFLDMEPEEVFENARGGDARCAGFVKMWHRALAAATANTIHLDGPGKFFVTGFNARHLDLNLLNQHLQEMVKMSPLQGYVFEVVPSEDNVAVIGAAVNALRAVFPA